MNRLSKAILTKLLNVSIAACVGNTQTERQSKHGAFIGAGTGALIGHAISGDVGGAFIGAGFGAILGGTAGLQVGAY